MSSFHRLAGKAIHAFRMWRIGRKASPIIHDLQRQLITAQKARKPTRHIYAAMRRVRHEGLRAQFGAN